MGDVDAWLCAYLANSPTEITKEAFWNEIKYKGIKWKLSKLGGQNENITKLKGSKVDFSLLVISIKKKKCFWNKFPSPLKATRKVYKDLVRKIWYWNP